MNNLIRQSHRWLSIVFTLTVIANFVALTQGQPPDWVTYSPLAPLAASVQRLYLFVLPYAPVAQLARVSGVSPHTTIKTRRLAVYPLGSAPSERPSRDAGAEE